MEVIDEIKLVGLIITDDLSWTKNTDSLVRRAFAKVWILRRLKALGALRKSLLLVYYRHVRSILEFGAPAWNGAITTREAAKLEREVLSKIAYRQQTQKSV